MAFPSKDRMAPKLWGILLAIFVLSALPGINSIPTTDRDEARYAQASKQMLESGDFVDIRFQDVPRHVKPAGTYWAEAASAAIFGGGVEAGIWAYRLPSFLGMAIAVIVTTLIGIKYAGGSLGVTTGLVLAVSLIGAVEARIAKTDALLLASIVIGQAALLRIAVESKGRDLAFWGAPLVFWLAHGAGLLIKGPIASLLLLSTALAYGFWQKDRDLLHRLHPLKGIVASLLVVAPWLILITEKVGFAFLEESVGHALMGKVAKGDDAHGAPPGYHSLVFFLTFWPTSILAVNAAAVAWYGRHKPEIRFLICWILPTLIVFELVATKLPHYTMPIYPAIGILAALSLAAEPLEGKWRIAEKICIAFGLLITAAVALVPVGATWHLMGIVPWQAWLSSAIGLALFISLWRWMQLMVIKRALILYGGVVLFYIGVFHFTIPALEPLWVSDRLANRVEQLEGCETLSVTSSGYSEPSVVFNLGTGTRLVPVDQAVRNLQETPECSVAVIEGREKERFISEIAKSGVETRLVDTLSGLNYSRGKEVVLEIHVHAESKLK